MTTQIDQDAVTLLQALASEPRDTYVGGADLATKTGLEPGRINDAMSLLVDSGLAEWLQVMGTAPYDFGEAMITARGRYELQRATETAKATKASGNTDAVAAVATPAIHPPSPVGSPYGFRDEDWEIVAERKGRQTSFGSYSGISSRRATMTPTSSRRTSRQRSKRPSSNITSGRWDRRSL
jgi:hypothetical protein